MTPSELARRVIQDFRKAGAEHVQQGKPKGNMPGLIHLKNLLQEGRLSDYADLTPTEIPGLVLEIVPEYKNVHPKHPLQGLSETIHELRREAKMVQGGSTPEEAIEQIKKERERQQQFY